MYLVIIYNGERQVIKKIFFSISARWTARSMQIVPAQLKTYLKFAGADVDALLFFMTLRSCFQRKVPPLSDQSIQPNFAIIAPAHNEEELIVVTIGKIFKLDYSADKFSLYVVADNCTDKTAEKAVAAGAKCLTRNDLTAHGRGHALAYAIASLKIENWDAILFLDADSKPETNYLSIMAKHLANGEKVIQGRYEVDDPDRNWFTRLTLTSFVLRNKWVFPAIDSLGITSPLRGSCMCFAGSIIQQLGWGTHGQTEDLEMTLRLIRAGVRVSYAPLAICYQHMPLPPTLANSQRLRWSAGESQLRSMLLRHEIPSAVCNGDFRNLAALLFIAAPALSVQLCAALAILILSFFAGSTLFIISIAVFLAYAAYFLMGFEKFSFHVLTTLAMIPVFAVWRVLTVFKAKLFKPSSWVRIPRK